MIDAPLCYINLEHLINYVTVQIQGTISGNPLLTTYTQSLVENLPLNLCLRESNLTEPATN